MRIHSFFRRLQGKITGLNAISSRFDQLENKVDTSIAIAQELAAEAERRRSAELELSSQLDSLRNGVELVRASLCADVPVNARFPREVSHWVTDESGAGRIGFLLHSLELVNHYGAVWDLLPDGAFDVLLHGVDEDEAMQALVAWRCGIFTTQTVLAEGHKYACLVSNHPVEIGDTPLIKQLAERNVRFMYAAGKSGWNLSDWNRLYDLILCFGPHHANAFAACTDGVVIQMGYPRFDRYFNEQIDRYALCNRFGCDPAKETVVWLPTWKDLSSVGYFDEEISTLMDRYNVVVKLHPLMLEAEPARVEALRQHRFTCLLTDSTDNMPLYQLADYMLFDFGGPPMAAIYCDKNMILLDVPDALSDPLLGSGSPDLAIRAQLGSLGSGCGSIASCLSNSEHWYTQQPMRKALRRTYFAPHFGFSAAVAANALLRLDAVLSAQA